MRRELSPAVMYRLACKSQFLAPLRPGENAWMPCTRVCLLPASAAGAVRPALPLSPFYTSVCIADEISVAGPAVDKGRNSQDPLCCGCQQNKAVMASSRESELCLQFIFLAAKAKNISRICETRIFSGFSFSCRPLS